MPALTAHGGHCCQGRMSEDIGLLTGTRGSNPVPIRFPMGSPIRGFGARAKTSESRFTTPTGAIAGLPEGTFGHRAGTRGELHVVGSPLVPRSFPPLASSSRSCRSGVATKRTMPINAESTTDAIRMEVIETYA